MEAWRFGFGASMPPAYKFDPTDADIVAHYLLPRAVGLPNHPHAHAVVDADPCSCPPWELLRRHGHAGSDHAFFFFRPAVPARTTKTCRRRTKRAISDSEGEEGGVGGTWAVQRSTEESLVLLRGGGGGEIDLRYTKRYLSHCRNEDGRTTGWAMDEYEIIDPPALYGAVLSRVRTAARGKSSLLMPSAGEDVGGYSALAGAVEDGGYYVDNSNSYFSEGIAFSNNNCFNEGDGSSYYFLQDGGGNGD